MQTKRKPLHSSLGWVQGRVCTEIGKQNSRTFPGLFQDFFHFSRTQFLPNLCKTTRKMHFFQAENVDVEIEKTKKPHSFPLIPIPVIKTEKTALIEKNRI